MIVSLRGYFADNMTGTFIGYAHCSTDNQDLATVRASDTLVLPKLDRLARSVPDARAIADQLLSRGVKLQLGSSIHDSHDPMGRMFFNIPATFAESRPT